MTTEGGETPRGDQASVGRIEIRTADARDAAAVDALYPAAFPDEDLSSLVRALRRETPTPLSMVATRDGALVGHIVFTPCGVADAPERFALLGPLAVAPDAQRRGVGGALVEAGIARLTVAGVAGIFVLGDPNYYSRFGFEPEIHVAPPCPIPDDWASAWRSRKLDRRAPTRKGALTVPPVWRRPDLWSP